MNFCELSMIHQPQMIKIEGINSILDMVCIPFEDSNYISSGMEDQTSSKPPAQPPSSESSS